jgi:hypothetical protein
MVFHKNKGQHHQHQGKQDRPPTDTVHPVPESISQIQIIFDKSEIRDNPRHAGQEQIKMQIILLQVPATVPVKTTRNQYR